MLTLLVWLLLFCVLYWAATRLMAAFGVGEPIHTVILVILVILAVYVLIGLVGIDTPRLNLR